MKILFVYPESYLNLGIPGGIAVMSALLKQRNHKVDLFDTCFLKTEEYQKTPRCSWRRRPFRQRRCKCL